MVKQKRECTRRCVLAFVLLQCSTWNVLGALLLKQFFILQTLFTKMLRLCYDNDKTLCYEVTAITTAQQQQAAKNFAAYWKDKGYEKGESQPFWLSLLRDVYGVEHPEQFIQFEEQVHLDHTSFIDGTIPATHVLIEQKGLGKDLNKPIKQSDGALLTPFEQAKRYILELPVSQHPRWVVTCNFSTFYVYDMERPRGEPEIIELANLEKEYYRLQFLVDAGNKHSNLIIFPTINKLNGRRSRPFSF